MAITGISVSQDNKIGTNQLMAVHSPLVFLIDAAYTGDVPDAIYVDVKNSDNELLDTFRCIPYSDLIEGTRTFMFIADAILRGFMDDFDDVAQTANSLQYLSKFTKIFNLVFRDSDSVPSQTIQITTLHAARQFGQSPCITDLNDDETIIALENMPVYAYYFSDAADVIEVRETPIMQANAQDFEGNDYTDYQGEVYTININ